MRFFVILGICCTYLFFFHSFSYAACIKKNKSGVMVFTDFGCNKGKPQEKEVQKEGENSEDFKGTYGKSFIKKWINTNDKTHGITRFTIYQKGDELFIHMWGKCTPEDCDWGETSTHITDAKDRELIFTWRKSYMISQQKLTLLPSGDVTLKSYTKFIDNSGRKEQHHTYSFRSE